MKRALSLAALLGACTLDTGTFAGKSCATLLDCLPPYTCADVRPGGPTCELLRPVVSSSTTGAASYYCAGPAGGPDVHTVVENFCLVNCHGSDMGYGNGVPTNFRLDFYAPQAGCGSTCQGAAFEAASMKLELDTGRMPPPDEPDLPHPSAMDALIIAQWVASGAKLAPDGVRVGNDCDAGGDEIVPDAGSPDAGRPDGGTDGG